MGVDGEAVVLERPPGRARSIASGVTPAPAQVGKPAAASSRRTAVTARDPSPDPSAGSPSASATRSSRSAHDARETSSVSARTRPTARPWGRWSPAPIACPSAWSAPQSDRFIERPARRLPSDIWARASRSEPSATARANPAATYRQASRPSATDPGLPFRTVTPPIACASASAPVSIVALRGSPRVASGSTSACCARISGDAIPSLRPVSGSVTTDPPDTSEPVPDVVGRATSGIRGSAIADPPGVEVGCGDALAERRPCALSHVERRPAADGNDARRAGARPAARRCRPPSPPSARRPASRASRCRRQAP